MAAVFFACGCAGMEQTTDGEQVPDDEETAAAAAAALEIESSSTSPRDDLLSGHWNLRPNGIGAWYFGAAVAQSTVGSASGAVSAEGVLEALCTDHDFCVDTNIAVDFKAGAARRFSTRYTLSSEGLEGDFAGLLVHRLGVAVFNIGADYATYDGQYVDAVGGYASQLGMTPTRPEIDLTHEGPYDGVFLLEIGAAANIAGLVIPAGGIVVAVPFDAVDCELYPEDCTR